MNIDTKAYYDFAAKVSAGHFTVAYWRKQGFPLATLPSVADSAMSAAAITAHLNTQFCIGLLASFKPMTTWITPVEPTPAEDVINPLFNNKKSRGRGKQKKDEVQVTLIRAVELGVFGYARWAEDLLVTAVKAGDDWAAAHCDDGKGRQGIIAREFYDLLCKNWKTAQRNLVSDDTPIEAKIECDYYENDYNRFRLDVFAATNTSDHPKRDSLFNKAWDIGDGNYGDVLHEYRELVDLLK